MIDTNTLSAATNFEVVTYFGVKVPRKVTASLEPEDGKFTNVKLLKFILGPVAFDAPDSFRGALDITYLDDELSLTRGNKGNILFVLTRIHGQLGIGITIILKRSPVMGMNQSAFDISLGAFPWHCFFLR